MNFIQLTPGAGLMYCGNCLRDNGLVAALRQMGHQAILTPLYLPLTLDEADQSAGTPVFLGGINVYLDQRFALFRSAPSWLRRRLASRRLLAWAAGRTARTRPEELGELTLSMLRGDEGFQARELRDLCGWLKTQPKPDALCLSNALLIGLARPLKLDLKAPVLCMLQGEDGFLDSLPEPFRARCWQVLAQRVRDADALVAPSRFFAELMSRRLGLPDGHVKVVYNGIRPDQAPPAPSAPGGGRNGTPVLGFFARMCSEKGLDLLVEAYVRLRKRGRVKGLRLKVGGSCSPRDAVLVETLKERLRSAGLETDTEFCPNLSREEKLAFLRSLSVFSVPARCTEAFGLYLLEALAAGVPVVQPRSGAFPELIEATGGGMLCEPADPESLAQALETLLLAPERARALGESGRRAVFERFSARRMAEGMLEVIAALLSHL
ncbi:MAG TPA: glycosyltransferase family 4 protein [Dongiaceae bacterium]|nr:glycosyltransferase family 4 protein [Dongiaceae bacterium]